jgi:succinate dehydrogenase/fumarate reductase flavoprotein subunit
MEYIQIHPHGNPKTGELMSHVAGRTSDTPYVNRDGKRFVDETGRRDEISRSILAQPGKVVFSIYDQKTVDSKRVLASHADQIVSQGYGDRADTIEELAKKAGIDPKGLAETIKKYNAAAESQSDKNLDVPKALLGSTVSKPPFYAVPLTVTIHHTMGGIRINDKAQVVGRNGQVIPGLYACGETTGGIHGANRLGRNALTDLLVIGGIAGKEAMKN